MVLSEERKLPKTMEDMPHIEGTVSICAHWEKSGRMHTKCNTKCNTKWKPREEIDCVRKSF
jgi:hypothetical protein